MHVTSFFTAGFLALGVPLSVLQLLPSPDSIPPIVVHRIAFDGGIIHQDRTITIANDAPFFFAEWHAEIIDAETGVAVPECSGSGSYKFPAGRRDVPMDLDYWTGNDACNLAVLAGGTYKLRASWLWGDDQTAAESDPFTVD